MNPFTWIKDKIFYILVFMLGLALVTIEYMSSRRKSEQLAREKKKGNVQKEGFKSIIKESERVEEKRKKVDKTKRDYFE